MLEPELKPQSVVQRCIARGGRDEDNFAGHNRARGFFALRWLTGNASGPVAASTPDPEQLPDVTRRLLMNAVMPVWLAAGVADWICQRATSIESTSGLKESAMHLLMLIEAAIPVLGGILLEITTPVLAMMILALLLHDATALWDVSYAVTRREVTPIEQHVHSFL